MNGAEPVQDAARPIEVFEALRPQLTGLAYRMTGALTEAEDIVQDAWLRWQRTDAGAVEVPKAFLFRIVTRLCIDRARSARLRREVYVGPWLPEPVADAGWPGAPAGPDAAAERADDLSVALLLVLERLSPLERAAFLLHDVFDLPFAEIATTLERTPAACRKLASRARGRVREARPGGALGPASIAAFAARFHEAVRTGDVATLAASLAEDAVLISDGGGKAYAALNPIRGRDHILRFLIGLVRKFGPPREVRRMRLNGGEGFLIVEADGTVQTWSLDFGARGEVTAIYAMRNPDKLGGVRGMA